ncbi:hypothetical protein UK23_40235 [Lentzea aerocolonigenes]|uniref:Right handed beta helix domain-containing protein n=1 Tax=Lentzea aerocolonigenes TaxID=68170 RepID=A0A0F0GEL4_LENAE|nr:right-handed parallel beta-helix repeat-containing protein [Lentzea aerocolonigenes]KJK40826.1 hypothetical protein UK23_40235 [Lentzea aerocolonigenes]
MTLALVAAVLSAPQDRTLTVGPGGQYATPQAAANAAQPGDTVEITQGTYAGGLTVKRDGITFRGNGNVTITPKLTINAGNLTFENLTFQGSDRFGAYADGRNNLTFRNLKINGSQDGGLVLLNTSNVLIDGCEITGTNARGTKADHEAMSIGHGSRDVEVRHCNVHDNGEEGIDVKYTENARVKIHDNIMSNNRGPNIYVDSATHVEVYNNISSGTKNETKSGIALAVEDYAENRVLDNVKVYNNISYGNAQAGLSIWVQSTGTVSNVQIINNTFYGNKKGSIWFGGDKYAGTNILRNNIFERATSHEAFKADHNHVGAEGPDTVDAGSAEGAPAFDIEGNPRPQGKAHDIGAHER